MKGVHILLEGLSGDAKSVAFDDEDEGDLSLQFFAVAHGHPGI
jgi:hypothetical protein